MGRVDATARAVLVFGFGVLAGWYLATHYFGAAPPGVSASVDPGGPASANAQSLTHQRVGESAGSGDGWTDFFPLQNGPAYITVRYSGSTPLRLQLYEDQGMPMVFGDEAEAVLGGQFKEWKAMARAPIDVPGHYRMRIVSDGDWKVTVAQ